MPAAEEPQAGVCAEVLARSYPSPPVGLLKAPFRRCGAISFQTSAQGHSRPGRASRKSGHAPYTPKAEVIQSISAKLLPGRFRTAFDRMQLAVFPFVQAPRRNRSLPPHVSPARSGRSNFGSRAASVVQLLFAFVPAFAYVMQMKINNEVTADRLRELLDYDPATGVFRWRKRRGVKAGSVAGCESNGHWVIRVDGVLYQAHRLAWLYHYGKWPNGLLDHRDLDGLNNRILNLRAATQSQNCANVKTRKHNMSGLKGVERVCGYTDRWQARITLSGKRRYLGCFNSPEAAHQAYLKAAKELFGEFARAA